MVSVKTKKRAPLCSVCGRPEGSRPHYWDEAELLLADIEEDKSLIPEKHKFLPREDKSQK